MSQGCTADTTEPYALRVIGDSMAPEFLNGHIIIVDPGHPLRDGAYVVILQQEEVLFGQYRRGSDGDSLNYLNPLHPGRRLDTGFRLKGVVIQRSTGRRKDLKHYEYPTQPHSQPPPSNPSQSGQR